jgi:RNA polymerase sigma-70 factor (ECF subfamily)
VITAAADSVTATVTRAGASPLTQSTPAKAALDAESREWLASLAPDARNRDAAIARLHDLLLRAARYEAARRRGSVPRVGAAELDDLIQQAADDALVAILAKLPTFRGASRFTTWAYKFALLEAGVKLRRRAWQHEEIQLDPDRWTLEADTGASPHDDVETAELVSALRDRVASELTPHQREVLISITLNGVPIDVLAERLTTTRGALYKTLHDARRKLRASLEAQGFELPAGRAKEGGRS